mmetsp:Transcript_1183/g.1672  ORF Transcript_1183/g.1672 Transcript_1183/m.1672 type:complete len:85 (+) Transcript_1183:499-753(+)
MLVEMLAEDLTSASCLLGVGSAAFSDVKDSQLFGHRRVDTHCHVKVSLRGSLPHGNGEALGDFAGVRTQDMEAHNRLLTRFIAD